MRPEELLDFVKECASHYTRPSSMSMEFSIEYSLRGIRVKARDYGHNCHFLIPFTDIELFGESAVTCYLSLLIRELRNSIRDVQNSLFEDAIRSMRKVPEIKRVIFNDPATIVFWDDNTKTIVKAENETFDAEKGLAMAIAKKALGNEGNYYNELKKHLGDAYETEI